MRSITRMTARLLLLTGLAVLVASGSLADGSDGNPAPALASPSSSFATPVDECPQVSGTAPVGPRTLEGAYGAQVRGFVADRPYAFVGRIELKPDGKAAANVTEVVAGVHDVFESTGGRWTASANGTCGEIVFGPQSGRCRRMVFFGAYERKALLLQCVPPSSPAADAVAANGNAFPIGVVPSSVHGTWSIQGEAFAADAPVALSGLVTLVGDASNNGTLNGKLIETQAGIRNDNSLSGSYSVSADGIGKATLNATHDPAAVGVHYEEVHHIRFVVVDNAKAALIILLESDRGVTLTARASRL